MTYHLRHLTKQWPTCSIKKASKLLFQRKLSKCSYYKPNELYGSFKGYSAKTMLRMLGLPVQDATMFRWNEHTALLLEIFDRQSCTVILRIKRTINFVLVNKAISLSLRIIENSTMKSRDLSDKTKNYTERVAIFLDRRIHWKKMTRPKLKLEDKNVPLCELWGK